MPSRLFRGANVVDDFESEIYSEVTRRLGIAQRTRQSPTYARFKATFLKQLKNILSKYRWGFADESAELPKITKTHLFFSSVFQLPGDFLSLNYANSAKIPEIIETPYNINQPYFLCNYGKCYMNYTKKVSAIGYENMTTAFAEALEIKIALKMCPFETQDRELYAELNGEFKMLDLDAVTVEQKNAQELQTLTNTDLLEARYNPYAGGVSNNRVTAGGVQPDVTFNVTGSVPPDQQAALDEQLRRARGDQS